MASNSMTHGRSGTPEYYSWCSMRNRCNNKNNAAYDSYGARGISVCARWDKFENFFSDMGVKTTPKHTLDRIDNDGGYSPENCRWATSYEQNRNKRNAALIEYHGVILPLWKWSILSGKSSGVIANRIIYGWDMVDVLNMPPIPGKKYQKSSIGSN